MFKKIIFLNQGDISLSKVGLKSLYIGVFTTGSFPIITLETFETPSVSRINLISLSVILSTLPDAGLNFISGSKDLENDKEYSSNPENTERIVRKEKLAIARTKTEKTEII